MKQRLLSLMAIACAMFTSTGAFAQMEFQLPDPVKPEKPVREAFNGTWASTLVAEKQYYFYNVAAAQFMGTGRDYGTRTVLTTDSIVSPAAAQNTKHATNKGFVHPYTVAAYGETGYFTFSPYKTDMSGYVTGEGNASWQDGNGDRVGQWQIVPVSDVENGFLLHCANAFEYKPYMEDDPATTDVDESTVLDEYRLLGACAIEQNSYTWNDLKVNGFNTAGESHKVVWKFIEATDEVAVSIREWREATKAALEEATIAYEAELAIYNARVVLKATIAEAEAAEVLDDAAIAVYNNPEATLADLQKQDSHLKAAMAGLMYKDIDEFNTASEDNPQDVTEYVLINPDFEQDYVQWKSYTEVEGWDITIEANNRCLQETAGTVNEELGYVKIDHFLEAWRDKTLSDGTISQTIYGLPAGKYMLECDAFTGQGTKTFEGIYIFIQSENGIEKKPMNTPDGQPMHFSVAYLNEGSDFLTFGLMAESTNANWIGCDNFKLTFYGATTKTQAQLDLEAAIATAEAYQETLSDKFFSEAVRNAFGDAISDAQDLVDDGTDDQCIAAKQNIEAQTSAVQNSIDAYAVLLKYLDLSDGGTGLLDKYYQTADGCGMTELAEKWDTWRNDWPDAYQYGEFSDDEIYELTSSIYTDLKAAWEDVNVDDLTVGTDLTVLIQNYDFSEGTYFAGWDAADDNPETYEQYGTIPGWTISSGNITQMKGGVIETYQRKFDFNQTIPNMPAGVYDITVQGFVSHNGAATNQTIFYAGDTQTSLMQRSDQWNATGFYLEGTTLPDVCGGPNKDQEITNSKSETVKVPNGMSGFYYWEQEENAEGASMDYPNWQEGDKYYTNHVKVILKQAGDFTIGMKSLGTTDWIIWDNFGLKYLGQDASLYDGMVEDKFKELDKVYDEEKIFITTGGKNLYDQLRSDINDAKGTLTAETEAAFETRIDEVIAYLNEGHTLALSLRDDLSDYEEIRLENMDLASPDNNNFIDWVGNQSNNFPVEDDYGMLTADELKDNETLQATAIDMNRRMADYVMQFAAANPYDETDGSMYGNATEAIFNPRYIKYDGTGQTTKGWTLEVPESLEGKAIGLGYNNAEMFNCSEFKISQTVRGLYPGWYLLTVDGFYRPGDYATIKTADDMQKKYVVMFAESGDLKDDKALKNIMEGAQPIQIAASDEVKVTVDEKDYWIPNMPVSAATYLHHEVGHLVDEEEVFNYIAVPMEESDGVYNSIYRNGMLVQVDESGELTIGLRKDANEVANDWTFFGNWTLTYFGEETNIPTAVETVEAKSAKNMIMDIFTIDGRQAQRLQRGINIVRTTDGKLHKVLVK